jgi:hypothetical protein
LGFSAIIASVVTNRPATEAAFYLDSRTTLVGSMMPAFTMSTYSPLCASKPRLRSFESSSLPTTTDPSVPAFSATCRTGYCNARLTMCSDLSHLASAPLSALTNQAMLGLRRRRRKLADVPAQRYPHPNMDKNDVFSGRREREPARIFRGSKPDIRARAFIMRDPLPAPAGRGSFYVLS